MQIDPRNFITSPFTACPKCGQTQFGTMHVGDHHISRCCRICGHSEGERLPPLAKKVLYLDQMILSNMAKTLDPEWSKQRPQHDQYWSRAFDALDRAAKLQLVVCPVSRTHERESVVLPHFQVLRRLYEHLSVDTEFEWPVKVHERQVIHGFKQWLNGEAVDYTSFPRKQVIRSDLTAWAERMTIRVNWPIADPDADEVRRTRKETHEAMVAIWTRWAAEQKSFDEVYQFERQGKTGATIRLLRDHLARVEHYNKTGEWSDDIWNTRLEIDVVNHLLGIANNAGLASPEAIGRVTEFLYSADCFDAPANDVNALLMAALARRAAAGQKPVGTGMWNDINTISSYLPYSDAMFLDDECVGLLSEGPLNAKIRHSARLFSNKSRESFIEYLQELERTAGAEHVQRVVHVYGDSWLKPYRSILQHERERQLKRTKPQS